MAHLSKAIDEVRAGEARALKAGGYEPVLKGSRWLLLKTQIEIWFSVLMKKVIKRGNFLSRDALKETILAFMDYFKKAIAKP